MSDNGKKVLIFVAFLTCLALVAAALFNIDSIIGSPNRVVSVDDADSDINVELNSVTIDGVKYMPRRKVKNYLIMGLDKFGDAEHRGVAQADFILVLSFDGESDEYTLLHVNRDTMTEIKMFDYYDGTMSRGVAQLALSHVDGTYKYVSNRASCENTAEAVSNLLYGVQFDGYVSMTMDAVKTIVDYIGGVPFEVVDDLTEIDEQLTKGSKVMLGGELALKLIRARGGLSDSTNVARMKRQRMFLDALIQRLDELNLGEDELVSCFDQTSSYMLAEKGVDTFYEIFGKLSTYECVGMIELPGQAIKGEKYMEFYVDDDGLKGIVKDVFYKAIE
jgi:LCP family protein required for cell wall assembly